MQTHKFCDNAENNRQSMKNGKSLCENTELAIYINLKFKNYIGDLCQRVVWKLMLIFDEKLMVWQLLLIFDEKLMVTEKAKETFLRCYFISVN